MTKCKDRVLGALLGVAIGDALGGPLEFMSNEEIQDTHGGTVTEMIGGGWLNLAPGEITDDTQMTLCVAEGIVESPSDPIPAIGRRFIEWLDSDPKDVGNCCRAVIGRARHARANSWDEWSAAAQTVHEITGGQTAGNGALMRAVYPALFYSAERREMADKIGCMTHTHSASRTAVTAFTKAIARAIDAKISNEDRKRIIMLQGRSVSCLVHNLRPDGYAPNGLIYAVKGIQEMETFEDTLIYAVNLGGDTDTIGAITGGLAGALYGASQIPPRWILALEPGLVKRMEELAVIAVENNLF